MWLVIANSILWVYKCLLYYVRKIYNAVAGMGLGALLGTITKHNGYISMLQCCLMQADAVKRFHN